MKKYSGLARRLVCLLLVFVLGVSLLPNVPMLTAWADDPAGQTDGTAAQGDGTAQDGETASGTAGTASDPSAVGASSGAVTRQAKSVANVVIFARLAGDTNNDFNRAGSWDAIRRQYEDSDTSFASYIYAVSGGRMQVENIFPQVDANGKIEVFQLSKSSYQNNAALVGEVVRALSSAQPGDTLYLDPDTYTLDNLNEGVLDNLTVVLQGGTFGSRNGAFAARYTDEEELPGAVQVSRYNALPSRELIDWTLEDGTQSKGGQGGQGVLANEFLHTLGMPDQNWINRSGVPVGAWDVMGTAAYVPQYPLGYQRKQLGWLDDGETETITEGGDYTLTAVDQANGVKLLMIETPQAGDSGEVICLEYREKASGDAFENGIYESGLILYRATPNGQTALSNELYVYRPGVTTPDGADDLNENGRNRVENAALTQDGAAYGSTDLSASFKKDTLYYSDGTNSGVRISGLQFSAKDHTVTFHVEIAEPGSSVVAAQPNDDSAAGAGDTLPAANGGDTAPAGESGTDEPGDGTAAGEPGDGDPDADEPGSGDSGSGEPSDGESSDGDEPDADQTAAEPSGGAVLLQLTPPEGYTVPEIYVDGIAYQAEAGEDGSFAAQLPDTTGRLAVMYFWNEKGVPKGMYVWELSYEGTACTATPLPGLQDLFSYHGFSIRVQSPSGIRFKSGISTALRAALTGDGVEGYRLTEYGTMSIAASNLEHYPFIKSCEKVRSGRSYWTENGKLNDNIIETVDGRYRFASVLTGVPDRQLGSEIAFRAYGVLVNEAGEEVIIYGPPVQRSIYTVAQQVAAAGEFKKGTAGYTYVQNLTTLGAPGWHTSGGQTWYTGADGGPLTGLQQVDGKQYYFNTAGDLQKGWQTLDGKRYYFDAGTGAQLTATGWQTIGGLQYYISPEGYALTGEVEINGEVWQLDEATGATYPNGWNTINGQIFYYQYGTYYKNGRYEIDKKLCHFTAEGYYVAPPVINNVLSASTTSTITVTVTATASALTTLNETAYSWDGGTTWVKNASKEFKEETTIPAGQIQVRDALGNVTAYGSALEVKLAPENNGPFMGIDVSSYQGAIDWKKVKASGVDFAIIRALTWSNSVGYYVIDPYFEYNVRNAKANGIKVGAYLFSYAFSLDEIKEEVDFFHNSTQMQALRKDNIQFDFPVYIDYEWNRILDYTDYNTRTQVVRTGMILLEKYGYLPGYYSSLSWAKNYYDAAGLAREGYDFWIARYPLNPDLTAGTSPWLGYQAPMWQYASDGKVNGITGNVDMNICYKNYGTAGGSTGSEVSLGLTVYDVNTSKVVTGSIEDILAQIVTNEVGGMNNAEVFKAQAVAAYSWILYQQAHGNAVPSVGLKTPTDAVRTAVKAVAGKALYYDGAVANAAYGSASAGKTNTARNMWGLELPYLNTPVESPETQWRGRQNTISLATMQNNLTKLVGAATVNATPHDKWLTDPVFDANGYLTSIKVCGQTVGGGRFYENCWGLYSPKFTFSYTPSSDSWVFTTDGNGHCVGMSQYGALAYAQKGWNYQQILAHYYPGTTLK